jgi:hypothetical protein
MHEKESYPSVGRFPQNPMDHPEAKLKPETAVVNFF